MKKLKKVTSILILAVVLLMQFSKITFAVTELTEAFISYDKDCGDHLEALDGDNWYTILASYVEYTAPDGKKYPAYCLDNTKPGVGSSLIGDLPEGYEVQIEKILDNNQVYRAAINGYPYKTPSQLGVKDKYDAYIATKQAIYSVLYNYDVDEHYRGVDERGENIHKAIKNIVDKARNGTETPRTALLTFKKDGGFTEDSSNNKYYSQTYSVNSDISMKEYKITATAKLPSGSFIAGEDGKSKTTFSADEKFKIMIPKESADKLEEVEGVLSVQAKCKNYPVFYAKKNTKLQPYALTFDPYGDNSAQLKVNFSMDTGKIKVNKIDSETSEPISGVTFQLSKEDGTVVANSTTDINGVATFSGLFPGSYKLKELSTNEKYIVNEKVFDVTVEYNKTTTETITNEHKKGDLKVYKVDKDNNKITIGNVEFELYSEEFKKVIGTYYTDVNRRIRN